jgi:hypothetical protein
VLAAGLDGLDRRLDAGPPLLLDPLRLGEEARLQLGVRRLPQSLPVALDALQTDPLLTGALGPELAAAYLAVKRQEAADFAAADVDYEFRQHFLWNWTDRQHPAALGDRPRGRRAPPARQTLGSHKERPHRCRGRAHGTITTEEDGA